MLIKRYSNSCGKYRAVITKLSLILLAFNSFVMSAELCIRKGSIARLCGEASCGGYTIEVGDR